LSRSQKNIFGTDSKSRSNIVFEAMAIQVPQAQIEPESFQANSRSNKFNDILNHFKKIISKVNF